MTCIAGLIYNGKVYMGADSAGVSGLSLTLRADQKVFYNGSFLMGFTTSFRMGQLLRYNFKPLEHPKDMDIYEYMVTKFIDTVRECLKEGGYAVKNDKKESGGNFLVGYKGRLFHIESDYQVGENIISYDACGCGKELALGSLYSTENLENPYKRIELALMAAEQFSAGVSRPFTILEL